MLNSSIICYNLSTFLLKTEEVERSSSSSLFWYDNSNNLPIINSEIFFRFFKNCCLYNEHTRNASRFINDLVYLLELLLACSLLRRLSQRLQTIAAQEQVKFGREQVAAQVDNNYEMQRQNDLKMINQGMMSKEEFLQRHPIDNIPREKLKS